jgi:hypothetical protein
VAADSGLSGLQSRLDAIQDLLDGDMTPMAHAVGKGARQDVTTVARSVSGGDGVLSHMGRKGARLGMRYEVEQRGRLTFIKLVPAGPWMLTQKGAKAHKIPRTSRRRGKPRFVMGAGYSHPMRAPVEHPGSGGRDSVQRAFAKVRASASKNFHDAYVQQLAKVMA